MTISIVICTKERIDDLKKCVQSIMKQTISPLELVIVDGSESDLTERYVKDLQKQAAFKCIHVKQTSGGLTRARNVGVKESSGDIILFLDDDVILDREYMKSIVKTYLEDRDGKLGGVEGLILPQRPISFSRKFFRYVFLIDSPKKGKVLASGFSSYPEASEKMYVDRLSGSNMSYRRQVFRSFSFDENLDGYGYIEDQDFSYCVSRKYQLLFEPKAILMHKVSKAGGRDFRKKYCAIILNRYYFVHKYVGRGIKQMAAFYWANLGVLLAATMQFVAYPSAKNYRILLGVKDGILRVLKGLTPGG